MTLESGTWFGAQAGAMLLSIFVGWRISRSHRRVWLGSASVATLVMLAWPLMRFFPARFTGWLGAHWLIFIEVTGIVVPAVLLFAIAGRHVRTPGERRVITLMLPVCCMYFLRTGLWMVHPPVPELGPMRVERGVCRQSTSYTCVAASLVTLLRSHGIPATETEMARMSFTEVYGGTTDSRAVQALEAKLAGQPFKVHFEEMDYPELMVVPKPCVVAIRWNYFTAHMVPVLDASAHWVVLGDPSQGVRRMPVDEFVRNWQNRGIYLTATGTSREK